MRSSSATPRLPRSCGPEELMPNGRVSSMQYQLRIMTGLEPEDRCGPAWKGHKLFIGFGPRRKVSRMDQCNVDADRGSPLTQYKSENKTTSTCTVPLVEAYSQELNYEPKCLVVKGLIDLDFWKRPLIALHSSSPSRYKLRVHGLHQ